MTLKPDDAGAPDAGADPLACFRTWRGFLVAAVAVNALFVWGMWGSVAHSGVGAWIKVFSWFPFNVIATVLYYVFMKKLSGPDARPAGGYYAALCLALIAANWGAMILA